MAGSTVVVAIGSVPTQLGGSGPQNSLIYNRDTVNAVWVSNQTNVSPGQGMRIGPLGKVQWFKDQGLAYAVVDTGVSTPVTLLLSNDVSALDNPVDVATATATALFNSGVPGTYFEESVYNGPIAFAPPNLDVSRFSTLVITLYVSQSAAAPATPGLAVVSFQTGGFSSESYMLTGFGIVSGILSDTSYTWLVPCSGGFLTVFGLGNVDAISIVGTNRSVNKFKLLSGDPTGLDANTIPRQFSDASAPGVGIDVQMLNADGRKNWTEFNGPVTLQYLNSTAGVLSFKYICPTVPNTGISTRASFFPTVVANARTLYSIMHPSNPLQWWTRYSVAGAQTSSLDIYAGFE